MALFFVIVLDDMNTYTPPFEENIRTPDRWQALWKHYDFRGATVLDLGCHTGEMCLRALYWGAEEVIGIDRDKDAIAKARDYRLPGIVYHQLDFLSTDPHVDVVLLLSVIGYLLEDYGQKQVATFLQHLAKNCDVIFIEPHYVGDGPGGFMDFLDFRKFALECGFQDVRDIVTLPVAGRDAKRTIFRCSRHSGPFVTNKWQALGSNVARTGDGRIQQLTNDQRPIEHLEREFEMLRLLPSPWFPKAYELGPSYLITEDLGDGEPITDVNKFRTNAGIVFEELKIARIQHGDATIRNIIVRDNIPVLIDFKESRFNWEDRPDKRPEGDGHHYFKAVEGLIVGNNRCLRAKI